MVSLELRKITPSPPGLSAQVTDALSIFSSLGISEISQTDLELTEFRKKNLDCTDCKKLFRLCEKILTQKHKVLACMIEMCELIQKEYCMRITTENELENLKNNPSLNSDMSLSSMRFGGLDNDSKIKDKKISELLEENKRLNISRIYNQKLICNLEKDNQNKLHQISILEKKIKDLELRPLSSCTECIEKDKENKNLAGHIQDLQKNIGFLNVKIVETNKLYSEKVNELQKLEIFNELLELIPEGNGRELRISIHKKICEIETDFIELTPNEESFDVIKAKYLQLPYLLKPIFDLTKQYEKSLQDIKKLLYS
ncbi:hypothetical protein SteCoe_6463 [Stentor coeruleus]|uniref:Uncharacterized protein n=1 Tax=Stentor coeruleus TaxID=5963 RepID=A0A1R2CQ16_9CILI|nr:hypothetical protein SteCoe_6463 [Stentor coeruleus]